MQVVYGGWRYVTMLSPEENERLTRVGPGTHAVS
jgi:hypothetical protein